MSWKINVTKLTWLVEPFSDLNQLVDISFRLAGSTDDFVFVGTATCNALGDITSDPSPFTIIGIDDTWPAVELRLVNQCNGIEFMQDVPNPGYVICIAASIIGAGILPNGIKDTPYAYSMALAGTAPFSLSGITKPAWMTVTLSGSNIIFGGTPPDIATDVSVAFVVSNCTDSELTISRTINVDPKTIYGSIVMQPHSLKVNLTSAALCDATFTIDGSMDVGGTPTPFSVTITVLAGQYSATSPSVGGGVITCVTPTDMSNYEFSGDCQNYLLSISTPC